VPFLKHEQLTLEIASLAFLSCSGQGCRRGALAVAYTKSTATTYQGAAESIIVHEYNL
jgi:hypothetical protein